MEATDFNNKIASSDFALPVFQTKNTYLKKVSKKII